MIGITGIIGHFINEFYNLQDNGLLVINVTIDNRLLRYVIVLKDVEYYEDITNSFQGYNSRKGMIIRYKSGKELFYWMDINKFREYYIKYLLSL